MSVHDNIFHNYKDHNPFWRARSPSYLERRNHLFITWRRRVPGMFSKFAWVYLAFVTLLGTMGFHKVRERRGRYLEVNFEFTRKALPFLQAIEDRRYLAIEQRKNWMLEELFKDNKEEYLYLNRLFHDPTIWAPPFSRTALYMSGIDRSYKSQGRRILTYFRGKDDYARGVPDAHY